MATNSIAISNDVGAISSWQGAVVVWGRFLFALIFLMLEPMILTSKPSPIQVPRGRCAR